MKVGESVNGQPNDNGPNAILKSRYNEVKSMWMPKYDTTNILPHHTNSILVEARDAFKVSSGKDIRDRFVRKIYPPLIPPNLTTNTQSYAASGQLSSGAKTEEINDIFRAT